MDMGVAAALNRLLLVAALLVAVLPPLAVYTLASSRAPPGQAPGPAPPPGQEVAGAPPPAPPCCPGVVAGVERAGWLRVRGVVAGWEEPGVLVLRAPDGGRVLVHVHGCWAAGPGAQPQPWRWLPLRPGTRVSVEGPVWRGVLHAYVLRVDGVVYRRVPCGAWGRGPWRGRG